MNTPYVPISVLNSIKFSETDTQLNNLVDVYYAIDNHLTASAKFKIALAIIQALGDSHEQWHFISTLAFDVISQGLHSGLLDKETYRYFKIMFGRTLPSVGEMPPGGAPSFELLL